MFHELQETYIPKKRSRKTMTMAMPRIRLVTFFLLIFFVIAVWLLTAHSHQGGNIVPDESKAFSTREALVQNAVAATAARDNRRRGRKIVVGKFVKQELMLEKGNVAASEKKGSSKMSSKQNEGTWSEEGQKRDGRSLLSEEINVGFVAFNADYHGPRHHPPKNN